jgi:hypothetical protein
MKAFVIFLCFVTFGGVCCRAGSLDLLASSNNEKHATDHLRDKPLVTEDKSYDKLPKLGKNRLIVRRGKPFTVKDWRSDYLPTDQVQIFFQECGLLKGSVRGLGECGVKKETAVTNWKIDRSANGDVTIKSDKDAAIGAYIMKAGDEEAEFILLFNPFDSRGPVGTGSKKVNLGRDFVLDDKTMIFQGNSDDHKGHVWDLDPGRGLNLMAALHLLRHLTLEQRSQPHVIARHLTFAINNEVCYGRWGAGDYEENNDRNYQYKCSKDKKSWMRKCQDPGNFKGSSQLLEQYMALVAEKESHTNVQYCQCFVFAGVTATIGRSLGIPTSVVTTFQSAHDVNGDRAISKFFESTPEGIYLPVEPEKGSGVGHGDSVWGFHVWNQMWIRRPDLTRSPRGWNAVDATPQEDSQGRSQMGPAPVKWLKKSKDGCYDNQFVISETNADINLYVRKQGSNEPFVYEDSYAADPFEDEMNTVGTLIVTSKPGCNTEEHDEASPSKNCKLDITNFYKYPEPSHPGKATPAGNIPKCLDIHTGKEGVPLREAKPQDPAVSLAEVAEAPIAAKKKSLFGHSNGKGDVNFKASFPPGQLSIGSETPYEVTLTVTNKHPSEKRTVAFAGLAFAIDYTGKRIVYKTTRQGKIYAKIAHKHKKKVLEPGSEHTFRLKLDLNQDTLSTIGVSKHMTSSALFTLSAAVKETGSVFVKERKRRMKGKAPTPGLVQASLLEYHAHEILDPTHPAFDKSKRYENRPYDPDLWAKTSPYHHSKEPPASNLNRDPLKSHDPAVLKNGLLTSYGAAQNQLPASPHAHPAMSMTPREINKHEEEARAKPRKWVEGLPKVPFKDSDLTKPYHKTGANYANIEPVSQERIIYTKK